MKKIVYILLLILPVFLFAARKEHISGYDIIPRTVNFFIFVGILYYIAAEPIKKFLVERRTSIAERLNSIQEKLKATNKEKEEAKELVAKAKAKAKSIVEIYAGETEIQKAKILEDFKLELENLSKGFEDQSKIDTRKMRREVISEVLDEVFKQDSISLKKDELLDIVMKKVA